MQHKFPNKKHINYSTKNKYINPNPNQTPQYSLQSHSLYIYKLTTHALIRFY